MQLLFQALTVFLRALALGDVQEGHHGASDLSCRWVPQRYRREHGPGDGTIGTTYPDGRGGLRLVGSQTLCDGIILDGTRAAILPDGLQGKVRHEVLEQVIIHEPEDAGGFSVSTDDTALERHLRNPTRDSFDNAAIEFLTRPQGLFCLLALGNINTGE